MKKSKTKSILACAVLASVMAVGNVAWAAPTQKTPTASNDYNYAVYWGENTQVKNSYATAWGQDTTAKNSYSTAWGYATTAAENVSTAWGARTYAGGYCSTAWGESSIASKRYSTAFGNSSRAGGENSLAALGGVTGTWTEAPVYDEDGKKWTSTGKVSSETGKTGANAVAIGQGANAKYDNSVAIGQYAVTGLGENTAAKEKTIVTNEFAVGGGNDGTNVYYSQITGVADGVNAHDAVNKGQLDAALENAGGGSELELKSGESNLELTTDQDDESKKILSLSSAPTFTGTVTAAGFKIDNNNSWDKTNGLKTTKVTVGNVVISNNKITGLADGTVNSTSTDAVNGKLLYNATTLTTAGKNYDANDTVVTAVSNLDTKIGTYDATNVKGKYTNGGNVATDVKALDTAIGDMSGFGSQNYAKNTANVAANLTALDGQVKTNTTAIGDASSGLVKDVADNKAAIATYKIKDLGTNSNLEVDANGKLTLKKTVDLTANGSLTIGNSVLNNTGLAITNGPSLTTTNGLYIANGNTWTTAGVLTATSGTIGGVSLSGNNIVATGDVKAATFTVGSNTYISSNGLNANSQKITNVLAPTADTDAANKKYVDDQISSGNALDVAYKTDSKTEIELAGEGGTTIHNVADGTVDTDAANVGQLKSAVGDAFTGADGSKGLRYDNTGEGKLVANVAFEGTSATFSGAVSAGSLSVGNGNTWSVSEGLKVTKATVGSVVIDSETSKITGLADGSVASGSKEAVNGGQLYTATHMGVTAGNYYSANADVVTAVGTLDTKVKANEDAISEINTTVGDYGNTVIETTYATTGTIAGDVKNLDTAIAAINNAETGVLKTAKDYTDTLASGQVTTNKNDIEALQTTVEDNRNTLQGQIDSIKSTGDKLGVYYENNEHTSITLKPTDGTVIHNLKAGTADMDAVNVKQLNDAITERLGENSNSTGEQAMALGPSNTVEGNNSTAVGSKNIVKGEASGAFGDPNIVYGDDSYAAGNENIIGVIANPSEVSVDAEGNIIGISDTDKKVNHAYAFGYGNKITADQGLAFGNNNVVSGAGGVAIGNGATASADNSVALGNGSVADVENTVSVGAKGAERKIVNVAEGNIAEGSTDAVNGGQLYEAKQEIAGNIQNEVNTINNNLDRMGTRINKVGAGAAALAAMHPVYDEDSKLTFSAGLGSYRNEQAAAVGMFFRFSPRVMMNAGATVGNDNNMYNVGLNFALDRHVGGGLPSKAVMARELTALREIVAKQDARAAEQDAKIAKLMAMVEALSANKQADKE